MEIAFFQMYLCKSDRGWSGRTTASHNVTGAGQEAAAHAAQRLDPEGKRRGNHIFCPSHSLSQLKNVLKSSVKFSEQHRGRNGNKSRVFI